MNIPSNYKQLLKNPKALSNFFLKPYGLNIAKNSRAYKPQKVQKFINTNVVLIRPQNPKKQLLENEMMFKVPQQISKPELKQYMEKLYGIEINDKIRTCRFMGRVIRTYGGYKQNKSYKKAWISLPNKVHEFLNYNPTAEGKPTQSKDNKETKQNTEKK